MAAKKRKPGRPKGLKAKPLKGGVLSNPFVASQVGAAIGSALAMIHVQDPKAFSRAFDGILPTIVSFGRDFERKDILAVLQGRRAKGLKVKDLVGLISSGGHVQKLDLKEIKRYLSLQLQVLTATMPTGWQEWRRDDPKKTSSKKGPRS